MALGESISGSSKLVTLSPARKRLAKKQQTRALRRAFKQGGIVLQANRYRGTCS